MSISGNAVAEKVLLEKSFMESSVSAQAGKLKSAATGTGQTSFEENLIQVETKELLGQLDTVAEKLFRFPSDRVLTEYRNVVGQILQKAEAMLEVRSDFSLLSGSSRLLIDRTKKGLRELEEVIGREGRRSRVMGITSEIRGCLVSLLA